MSTSIFWCSVQLLSCVWLFVTPWTAARWASLSITNSQSLLKLMSNELVMPSNHLILCCPLRPTFNLSQHQSLFNWVSSSHQVAKVLEFQLQHQFFQWIFRIDFLRIDWLDLLAVQGTLQFLLQCHSSKAALFWHSAFFILQLLHLYMTTGNNGINWLIFGRPNGFTCNGTQHNMGVQTCAMTAETKPVKCFS